MNGRGLGWLFGGAALAVAAAAACSRPSPSPAAEAPPSAAAPTAAPARDLAAPQPTEPSAAPAPSPEIAEALTAIVDRHKCNRLMGCAPQTTLLAHGAAAIPAVLALLQTARTRDGYWIIALLDLLGRVDDPRVIEPLQAWLSDGRWEVRTRAALALAERASPESQAALVAALEAANGKGDVAFEAAVLYALDRLGATVGDQPARAALTARLNLDYDALSTMNPGFYTALTEVVALSRVTEALPLVRLGITHRDRYVRIGAIAAASALNDTGAIRFLVGRLDDPLPSVRRATVAALRAITGSEGLRDAAQWAAWCEETKCRADLREGMPVGTPETPTDGGVGPGLVRPPAIAP
jgi:hypothetical protein